MSVGTGAIKGWWGLCKNTKHSREVPSQPCEREQAQGMHFLSKVLGESRGPQTMCSIMCAVKSTQCTYLSVHRERLFYSRLSR